MLKLSLGKILITHILKDTYMEIQMTSRLHLKTKIELKEKTHFKIEFEPLKGRVDLINIDYETNCGKNSVLKMISRINGKSDDTIKIKGVGNLIKNYARALLISRVAVRGNQK